MVLFSVYDAISKYLTRDYPVAELLWIRYLAHVIFMLAVFGPRMRLSLVKTHRPVLQVLRALLLVGSAYLFMCGVRYIPLGDATAINFVSPLLLTALSVPMLGEKVETRNWVAVILGFGGVLLIVRPGGGMLQLAALFPFFSACCSSFYQILTRKFRGSENPITMHFYTGLVGLAATSLAWQSSWTIQTFVHAFLLTCHALSAGIGHYLLIEAFRRIGPAVAAPFTYTQLVCALLFGWVIYGEIPDAISFFGILIIVGSGLYVAHRQGKR
jgi:drug/metabolite transporter (DMT)-like permease